MGLRVVQRAAIPPSPALYNTSNAGQQFYCGNLNEQTTKSPANIDAITSSPTTGGKDQQKKSSKKVKHQNFTLHSCLEASSSIKNFETIPQSTSSSAQQQMLKENNSNQNVYESININKAIASNIQELNDSVPGPNGTIVKTFMMSEGQIELKGSLDKSIYSHGEAIKVQVYINNCSHKTIRRIKIFIVQHVDVCMFSNGKFKNVVANIDSKDDCPITPNTSITKVYALKPIRSSTKNWIALEDSYSKLGTSLASTVTPHGKGTEEERNVFAIYVSYYVKIKLIVSVTTSEISLKLPFTLMHTCSELDCDFNTSYLQSKLDKENMDQTATTTLSDDT